MHARRRCAIGASSPTCADFRDGASAYSAPADIADQIINAIDQPWGISLGDITVRAGGDGYIL